jgi:alpha-mannosidase
MMMKRSVLCFLTTILSCVCAFSQDVAVQPDPYKPTLDHLASLTKQWQPDWRMHSDIARPEATTVDDSTWPVVHVDDAPDILKNKNQIWAGPQVFRRLIEIPATINGYSTEGSRVLLDLRFFTHQILLPGKLRITIFSNGSILYRGQDDNLQPVILTANAHPGQKFLVAVRVVTEEDIKSELYYSELTIEPPASRPDPGFLRMEILAAHTIIDAYEAGKAERRAALDAAVKAIDFSTIQKGDQASFDASLRAAQEKLLPLKPWLQQFSIRAIGNSHIDMAWLWSWTETVEIVRNTFQTVLDLMREYPDFKFTMSSARAYEWMQEKYPELFAQIQRRVKEGRWEIVGGMWIEPDLNMPAGESLVRQILIGKNYFKKNFGVDVNIGWNPDSFGYNWQMPQIYKKSGIDYFVTQKLIWAHDFSAFPYKLFWWESPDGSRVLTYFPHHYGDSIDGESLAQNISVWMPEMYGQDTSRAEMMHLYGVGDHGGGPTRTMLDHAAQLTSSEAIFPKFQFSFARDFFSDLEKQLPTMNVPTWDGELYYQGHRGVFTTQSETKKRIRRAEEQILTAEKFGGVATLYGYVYPQDDMQLAWKNLLFDHFHDVMPGSGVAVNYVEAKRNLDDVGRVTNRVTQDALHKIVEHTNTQGNGVPVVVFNSLSWQRHEVASLEAQLPAPAKDIVVLDGDGKIIPSQLLSIDPETHRAHFLASVDIPSLGYRTYFVRAGVKPSPSPSTLKASSDSLENEFLRLKIDPQSGCMTSLILKHSDKETLSPSETDTGGPQTSVCGNLLQAFADNPRLMGVWNLDAWNIDADFEKQHWDVSQADEVTLLEKGPLRATIRIKQHFQNSTFIRDVTLYSGVPRVDVKTQIEWHEKHILLKVAFPLNVHSDKATYEIPYGSVQRPTTRNTPIEQAQFEVPAQQWADLSENSHGFSLLNDSKYGYDAKGNVLRLTLLRSTDFPDPHADEGHHEFTYSLYPHEGNWQQANTIERGYELNYRFLSLETAQHQGPLPATASFLQVKSDNVIVTALKKAEDDGSLIVRFYEWAGKDTDVALEFPSPVKSAEETDLMEHSLKSCSAMGKTVTVRTKPYEIKTLKLQLSSPEPQ